MAQSHQRLGVFRELFERARVERLARDHLDGDGAAELRVLRAVDGAVRSLAERGLHLVLADAVAVAHAASSSGSRVGCGGRTGSVMVKAAPSPGRERTSMRPPCSVMIL